jgi:TfoX/Sxy family transcriptional regulator of competence genes
MAYDERLNERLRATTAEVLGAETPVVEKKMFGGLALMVHGNMACGVYQDSVLVRVDPATSADVLTEPSVRPFDMGRGPSKGWVLVDPAGVVDTDDLRRWVLRSTTYARSLPPK